MKKLIIEIDQELYKRIRMNCAMEGITIKEFVTRILEQKLK